MKFKNEFDKKKYELLNEDEKIIRKKLDIIKKSIDRKKSRNMKLNWNRNRIKMQQALKKWHNSTQGKRFHRALARYNATRLKEEDGNLIISIEKVTEALLGINSIETHLYLELQYYESDIQTLYEFLEVLHSFLEVANPLKEAYLNAYISGVISKEVDEELKNLFSFFLDPVIYYYEKRNLNGLTNDINIVENKNKFKNNLDIINNNIYNENIFTLIDNMIEEDLKNIK